MPELGKSILVWHSAEERPETNYHEHSWTHYSKTLLLIVRSHLSGSGYYDGDLDVFMFESDTRILPEDIERWAYLPTEMIPMDGKENQ